MAKAKKIFSIILVLILCVAMMTGCSLFELNQQRYRNQATVKTGDVTLTLGDAIDFFESNAPYYVQQGMTVQAAWDALYPQFVQQAVILDEYLKTHDAINTSDKAKKYRYGTYVSDEYLEYVEKQNTLSFFASLDSLTLENLKEDFNIGSKTTQSRTSLTEKGTLTSLAEDEITFDLAAVNKELKNYQEPVDGKYEYVFRNNEDAALLKILANLNERLEKEKPSDADITADDYVKAQNSAVESLTRNIKKNRGLSVDEFMTRQVESAVRQRLVSNYAVSLYKKAELQDNPAQLKQILTERWNNEVAKAKQRYSVDANLFISDVTGLSSTSFIYNVPAQFEGKFHYVKNLLIPFSDEQTSELNRQKNLLGENSADYVRFRNQLAKGIEVKNYSEEDAGVVESGYTFDVAADGTVTGNFLTEKVAGLDGDLNAFVKLIHTYGTDPGMFNNAHDYVISQDSYDVTNSSQDKFVKAFSEAARKLANNPSQRYVACVTDYGIHILYYSGVVKADEFDFDSRYEYGTGAGSTSYRFFKTYYDSVKGNTYSLSLNETMKKLLENKGIEENLKALNDYVGKYQISTTSIYTQKESNK